MSCRAEKSHFRGFVHEIFNDSWVQKFPWKSNVQYVLNGISSKDYCFSRKGSVHQQFQGRLYYTLLMGRLDFRAIDTGLQK